MAPFSSPHDSLHYPLKIHHQGDDVRHLLDHRDMIYQNPAPLNTLTRLCVDVVVDHVDLVETLSSLLPQHLREQMIVKYFEEKRRDCLIPLFYTWSRPVLSFGDLFPHYLHYGKAVNCLDFNDRVIGFGKYFKQVVLSFIQSKVICIKQSSSKAVKIIDFRGILIKSRDMRNLIEQTRFTSTESTTFIIDIMFRDIDVDESSTSSAVNNWLQVLAEREHINIKVNVINLVNVREPYRNKLIHSLVEDHDIKGVCLEGFEFENWPHLQRSLAPIVKLTSITNLGLTNCNLFDDSPNDQAGRLWINNFLQQLNHLSRLDLSCNLLTGRINVLVDLNLEYLAVRRCSLEAGDFLELFEMKGLKHLDVSNNRLPRLDLNLINVNNDLEKLELDDMILLYDHHLPVHHLVKKFKALQFFSFLNPDFRCNVYPFEVDEMYQLLTLDLPRVNISIPNSQINMSAFNEMMKMRHYNYYCVTGEFDDDETICIRAVKAAEN